MSIGEAKNDQWRRYPLGHAVAWIRELRRGSQDLPFKIPRGNICVPSPPLFMTDWGLDHVANTKRKEKMTANLVPLSLSPCPSHRQQKSNVRLPLPRTRMATRTPRTSTMERTFKRRISMQATTKPRMATTRDCTNRLPPLYPLFHLHSRVFHL